MYKPDAMSDGQVGLNLPPPVVDPDDPLLIAQTLTYVTDDGSVLLSFTSAPFSFGEFVLVVFAGWAQECSTPLFCLLSPDGISRLPPTPSLLNSQSPLPPPPPPLLSP
jgi:hypothetical protein